MNDLAKTLLLWLIGAVVLMALFKSFSAPVGAPTGELTYNEFIQEIKSDRVAKVTIDSNNIGITGERKDGSKFTTANPSDTRTAPVLLPSMQRRKSSIVRCSSCSG